MKSKISIIGILALILISGCTTIAEQNPDDYVICGYVASCPEGYKTQLMGFDCLRCYIPKKMNYEFNFTEVCINHLERLKNE